MAVGVLEEIGVQPIINLAGAATRLGGPITPKEVADAMTEAASECVAMVELQAAASRLIAEKTGADAGYITSGAAAALTLATAASLAKLDTQRMESLPDTEGMPNEVIIAREHRNGYDHAIRAAGAKLVEVGMNEVLAGAGARTTEAWEYDAAISERSAAIAYFARPGSNPPLEQVVEVGKKHRLPVIVDAAAQLPPVENLRRFTELGADLVTFSGGKAIRGPQNTGILAGNRTLVASAALQNLDLDEHSDIWNPPTFFISKEELRGLPRHGIGRGFKVSKEAVVGLLVALRLFTPEGCTQDAARFSANLRPIKDALSGLRGVHVEEVTPGNPQSFPVLHVTVDATELLEDAFEISRKLKTGNPPVYVKESLLSQSKLIIDGMNLTEDRTASVVHRFREVLGAHDA